MQLNQDCIIIESSKALRTGSWKCNMLRCTLQWIFFLSHGVVPGISIPSPCEGFSPRSYYLIKLHSFVKILTNLMVTWWLCTILLGWIVRKVVTTNMGIKINQSINFSSIKMFFTSYVLCSLRLFKLTTEHY